MNDFNLLIAQYNSALPSLSDGDYKGVQVDASGRLIISGRYFEDEAHTSGDAGLFMMGVRHDADTSMVSADGDYAPFQVDAEGRLKVSGKISVEPSDAEFAEDSANASGDTGLHVLTVRQDVLASSTSADGDYADFKVNAAGELYVHDTDVKAELVAANASLDAIEASAGSIDTKLTTTNSTLATIDTSLNNIETSAGNIDTSTASMDTKLTTTNSTLATIDTSLNNIETSAGNIDTSTASIDTKLTTTNSTLATMDTSLNNIETSAGNIDTSTASIDTKLTTTNSTLGTIDTSLNNIESSVGSIDTEIQALSQAEDAVHSSGDAGMMSLAVSHAAESSMVSADGDYAPLQVNAIGRLKVDAVVSSDFVKGAPSYNATDDLAAAGDGLVTIVAALTPFADACSISVGAGQKLYIYGYEWCCDQNADARIVSDDGSDVKVYKRSLNSSSQPTVGFSFSEGGRIEIDGSATMTVKLQIKKRSTPGGNANGSGSLHARLV